MTASRRVAAICIALGLLNLGLYAWPQRPTPLAVASPSAAAPPPPQAMALPSMVPLRDTIPLPGGDPLDSLVDVPPEQVYAALRVMATHPATAPRAEQAARLASDVGVLDNSARFEAIFAEGIRAGLDPRQADRLATRPATPLREGDSGVAVLEALCQRAGEAVPAEARVPPPPAASASVPSWAAPAALLGGLASLELTRDQAKRLLPYVEVCVAERQQVKHLKKSLMDLLSPQQRETVKGSLPQAPIPAAALLAVLQPIAGSAPLPGMPQDPGTLPGAEHWRGHASTVPDSVLARARGRKIYQRLCLSCHGAEGHGNGPGATGLFPKPHSFTEGTNKYGSAEWQVLRTVMEGVPATGMPGFRGRLSETEAWTLLRYTDSLQRDFK